MIDTNLTISDILLLRKLHWPLLNMQKPVIISYSIGVLVIWSFKYLWNIAPLLENLPILTSNSIGASMALIIVAFIKAT